MPGASTPTFVVKHQNIGMNIIATYQVPYAHPNTPIGNNNISSLQDPKRHGDDCCYPVRYDELSPADVDPEIEEHVALQFPRFSNRIHQLVEDRREFLNRPVDNNNKRCVIL